MYCVAGPCDSNVNEAGNISPSGTLSNIVEVTQLCYERWVEDMEMPEIGMTREKIVKLAEKRSAEAISVPFATLPKNMYIKGPRYTIKFPRLGDL